MLEREERKLVHSTHFEEVHSRRAVLSLASKPISGEPDNRNSGQPDLGFEGYSHHANFCLIALKPETEASPQQED